MPAFGRCPDFDATIDPIVRIQASRLRRNLDLYFREEGQNDEVFISLPKGTYVPEFSFSKQSYQSAEDLSTNSNSVAVYPIKNLGGDEEKQYIADGFSQELLAELARYKDIEVIRGRDEEYDSTKLSLSRFSLVGSIRFGRESDKLSTELTENYTHRVIWSDQKKFNYADCELIRVQEEIAHSIAQKIADVNGVICETLLSESNWKDTNSLSAYDALLHFHEYNKNPSESRAREALEKLTEAVQREPDFGPGFAVLANFLTDAYVFGLDRESLELALEYGKKAVQLQANNQVCQLYYAFPLMVANQLEEAEKHLQIGFCLNRNAT